MPTTRHIIVCEGESEHAYLQNLQRFLNSQETPNGDFDPPLLFIAPTHSLAKTGSFGKLKSAYKRTRKDNKRAPSIQIWTDFDLYHRNNKHCAENYAAKTAGIPDFHFSFHNFEDFFALHWEGAPFENRLRFGSPAGRNHFVTPLHSQDYLPEIQRIFPSYTKGTLPTDFISWASLRNLKINLKNQPKSNPYDLKGIRSFAEFLITQIERAYPEYF